MFAGGSRYSPVLHDFYNSGLRIEKHRSLNPYRSRISQVIKWPYCFLESSESMSTSPFVLLPSSHARSHEQFPATGQLEAQLRARIRGEVRFDAGSRALYSTDSSNYRHIPIGLVIPRDEDDVI